MELYHQASESMIILFTEQAYVEKKALEYLRDTLRPDQAYQSLKYWVTEEGEHKEAELDGLLVIDSALFLVEAKAGSITQPARRGAAASLQTDLQKLVGDSYSQALRARNISRKWINRPSPSPMVVLCKYRR